MNQIKFNGYFSDVYHDTPRHQLLVMLAVMKKTVKHYHK